MNFGEALDRHITGNYGEDQYRDFEICDGCEHDNPKTGGCDKHNDPSVCKAERREDYLADKAERDRMERCDDE